MASVAAVVFGLLGARQRWQGYAGRWLVVPGVLVGTVMTTVILLDGLLLAFFAALDAFFKSINLM